MRYGVIGCGRVFQRYHLPCLEARAEIDVVAACDVDTGRARSLLANFPGAFVSSSLDEFFDRSLDAVSICTPNDQHAGPVLTALAEGVGVLCEKPLAGRIEEAREIAGAAAGAELFGVNLPYQLYPLLSRFAEATRDSATEVQLSMSTPGDRMWRPYTRWYGDAGRAGHGALLDLGIHALDVLVKAFGWPTVECCTVDNLVLDQRAVVQLSCGAVPVTLRIDRASPSVRMSVAATTGDGAVVLDLRRGELQLADGHVVMARPRPELAAVTGFLDAATGVTGAVVVGADHALRLQELVEAAYRVASEEPLTSLF